MLHCEILFIAYMFAWSVMVVNQVDAALARPAGETGTALLALPEDQWFDRKSVRVSPKDLGPPLTAFANAEGGTVVGAGCCTWFDCGNWCTAR